MTLYSVLRTGTALALIAAIAAPADAQVALEEIVVTARKREESLQEIPIAITAFSAEQLDRAGITRLEELTAQVAGVQYHSLGLAIPGRVNSSIRFRGMDVNSQVPTFQLGTLFVDGVYVLGGTHSIPLDDVERVEVVKGPQSAYFGRNTFGGAINYITKTPSTTEYLGEIQAQAATYDEYDVSAAHSGPIVEGKLAYRIGGRLYSRGAMFTATDGGGLGKESTKTVSGSFYATPTDALSIKVRGFYGYDDDGPAAGGAIPGRLNDTCSGKTVTTKAGETVRPIRFICGKVPEQGEAISTLGNTKIIDSNTTSRAPRALITTGDPDFLINNLIRFPQPANIDVPEVDGIGLKREVMRFSGQISYEFANGITAEAQGGYNTLKANWVRDYNFTAFDNGYSRDPQDTKDFSIEGRVSSSQEQRLRWLGGVNYYEQDLITSGSGGDSVYFCVDSVPGLPIGACVPGPGVQSFLVFRNALNNTDHVETLGFFAAAAFDVTDQLTLNLEGRYQKDDFTRGLITKTTATYKSFIPRVILQYEPSGNTNLYASYAKGVLPGEINQLVVDADARERAQFAAAGVVDFLDEEKLDSYEIGWKQQLLDRRLSFSAAAYYGEWGNKKSRIVTLTNYTCGDAPATIGTLGCRPNLGEASAGQPARQANGTPVLLTGNVVVAGDSKIWGFEFEANAALAEGWTAGFTFDYAGNKFTNFIANFIQPYAQFTNVKGNAHGRFPKFSGSFNTSYTASLNDTWDWFVRGDTHYFGKTWVDVDNLAFCDAYWLVNARAGVEREGLRVELFVKNLFNDDSWSACSRFSEFDLPFESTQRTAYQSVIVAPQNKRQFGIKTSIRF